MIDCFSDESLKKAIVGAGKASTVHWEMILIIIMIVMVIVMVMVMCLVMISDGFDDKLNITFSLKVSPLNTVVTEGAVMVGGPRIFQVFTSLHLKLITQFLCNSQYLQFIEN